MMQMTMRAKGLLGAAPTTLSRCSCAECCSDLLLAAE